MLTDLAAYTGTAVLLVLLPGPDTMVVVRGLVRGGRRGGARTAAGVLCALAIWVTAACLGLSALLQASKIGYDVLRLAGACYLVWLGAQSLWSTRRPPAENTARPAVRRSRSGFTAGFVSDILNPKIGILFVTLLPAFVPHGYSVAWTTLGLGVLFMAFTALYFAALVVASTRIATWMQTPHIRRRLDAFSGLVLVGFGLRMAVEA